MPGVHKLFGVILNNNYKLL